MITAFGVEATGSRPGTDRRIVKFRARQPGKGDEVVTPRNKDLAVRQQHRPVIYALRGHAAGRRPDSARRIVQLSAPEINVVNATSTCSKHLAVGQQRHYMTCTGAFKAARERPGPGCRIVELRACANTAAAAKTRIAACDEHLAVR